MSLIAETLDFGSLPSYKYGSDPYNPSKLGLGPMMVQRNSPDRKNRFVGPYPLAVARPQEETLAFQVGYPWAMRWSEEIDWVFLVELSTASPTRRVMQYSYNRETGIFNYSGAITLTYPTTTNHTVRAMRMTYDLHTAGTVQSVGGTGAEIVGVGTSWLIDGACVGNRIGFGSTNPAEITQWHEIVSISTDQSLTLGATEIPALPSGTPYVIEDLRCITLNTNATAANGGLFVTKGLRVENFTSVATVIPAATTVDNRRAVYRIGATATAGLGLGIQEQTSKSTHYAWAANGTSTPALYKYNLRAPLTTLNAGTSSDAFVFATAAVSVVGTPSLINNGRVAKTEHVAAGRECFYFTTTTRLIRTRPLDDITPNDNAFIIYGDTMLEVPPGGTSTTPASGALQSVEYSGTIDAFYIALSGSTSGQRDYVTKFRGGSVAADRSIGGDVRQYLQSSSQAVAPSMSRNSSYFMPWIEGGLGYFVTFGSSAATNVVLAVPIGADMDYAERTNSKIVLPKFQIPSSHKLHRVVVQNTESIGDFVGLSMSAEPFAIYYRTAGIDDDSGAWTQLDQTGSMSGIDAAPEIQFMLTFRTIGVSCIPARVHSLALIYEKDEALPPGFRWNLGDSSNTSGTIGIVQTSLVSSLAKMTVTYYRADTNQPVLVQSSDNSAFGNWESFDEGSASWSAGLGENAVGTRRRFVPNSGLPVGVDLYAKVTVE